MTFRVPDRAAPESQRVGAKDVKRYAGRVTAVIREGRQRTLDLKLWEVISVRPTVLGSEDPEGQWTSMLLLGGTVRAKGRFQSGTPVGIFTWTDAKGVERCFVEALG